MIQVPVQTAETWENRGFYLIATITYETGKKDAVMAHITEDTAC